MDAAAGEPQFTPPLSPIQVAEEELQGGREEGKCGDAQAVSSNNARSLQWNLRSDVRDAFNRREAAVSAATAAAAAETKGDWVLELDGPAGSYACGASAEAPCRHTSNPASATVREACCLVALRRGNRRNTWAFRVHMKGCTAQKNEWFASSHVLRTDLEDEAKKMLADPTQRIWDQQERRFVSKTDQPGSSAETLRGARSLPAGSAAHQQRAAVAVALPALESIGANPSTWPEAVRDAAQAWPSRKKHKAALMRLALGVAQDVLDKCEERHIQAVTDPSSVILPVEHPELPVQYASLLLRCCQLPRLGYLARTVHPDRLAAAAERFDERAALLENHTSHLRCRSERTM
jgi:hypothetical protein